MNRQERTTQFAGQRGISLIEVLVSVVIIAVGLLGIATLQFMSKRSNFEAVERTLATQLVNDIIERMRSNAKELDTYAGTATSIPPPLTGDSARPAKDCTRANPCDPEELAVWDLYEWDQAIAGATETSAGAKTGGLASPTACLSTTVPAGGDKSGQYTVAIAWRGPTELSDPENPTSPAPANDPWACGRSTGALGAGKYDSATVRNAHRRILVVNTYIAAIED